MNYWNILGIKQTADQKQVKRAYAKLLKLHKPEQDPEGYQRLRDAFDQAIQYCKQNGDGSRATRPSVLINSDSYKDLDGDEPGFVNTNNQTSNDIERIQSDPEPSKDRRQIYEKSKEDCIFANNIIKNEQHKKDERDRIRESEAQERLRIQQGIELNAEQQRIKEQQEHLLADDLESILLNILSLDDISDAISAFQVALNTDILLNLKNRKMFERMCFGSVIEWDSSRCFPSELFMHMADEFDWYDKNPTDPYFLENIYALRTRISAGMEYQALVELAKKRKHFSRESSDGISKIYAAETILGAYRPILFSIRLFIDGVPVSIKNILYTFTEKYPLESCPEIDNESFRWWLRHQGQYNFTIAHVLIGVFLAMLVVFGAMDNISEPIGEVSLMLISSVSTIAGSVASWWVLRFVSHWWSRAVPVIKDVLEEIKYNPYIFWGLTALYVLLFLVSAYVDDQNYVVLWFCIASVLVILLLGSSIFLVGISAIGYFVVSANMEVLIPNQAFKYLFIYISIASYYVWLGVVRKLPSRISGVFTERFFGIFISLVLISASLSYLSLVTLNAIYQ